MTDFKSKELVVIGASAGGIQAVENILQGLNERFPLPMVLVEHHRGGQASDLSVVFNRHSSMPSKEAESGEPLKNGHLYVAPGDYHVLVERDKTLSLSVDDRVNWCRPSIDVLFESAAVALGSKVIAILLTGANADGAIGVKRLKEAGAYIMVQDPDEADFPTMPKAALKLAELDRSYLLREINEGLLQVQEEGHEH